MNTRIHPEITPFWLRIPHFFAYPLDLSALIFIGLLSLMFFIDMRFMGGLGFFLFCAAYVLFFKYAYSVLERTAQGHLDLPELSLDTLAPVNLILYKQLLILTLILASVAYLATITTIGTLILGVFYLLVLPASIMTLAYQDNMLEAINPATLFLFITRIGLPYLAFLALLLCLLTGFVLLAWGIGHYTNSLYIQNFMMMYSLLVIYHLMGYLMYQYHDELGIPVITPEDHLPQSKAATQAIDHELTALIQQGDFNQAIAIMQEQLKQPGITSELYERYHQLLLLANHPRLATKNGRQYINILLYNDKNPRRAVEIFQECQQLDSQFAVSDPDSIYELASTAMQMRAFKTAIAIIGRFQEEHPHHRDIPRTYLLAAKILCEELSDDMKAKKILEFLMQKFPHHALAPEIQQYLNLVNKLSS